MNYIALIRHFWKVRKKVRFTDSEAFLYFYLLEICNELEWENPFPHPNTLACTSLGFSEEKLTRARNGLKQKGMIDFVGGEKNKRSPVYEIFTPQKAGKSVGNDEGKSAGKSVGNDEGKTPNIEDKLNKTKLDERVKGSATAFAYNSYTLSDLQGTCGLNGVPPDFTESWWMHYEANGWLDGTGKRIVKPDMKVLSFWRNGKQYPKQTVNNNGSYTKPTSSGIRPSDDKYSHLNF